jgi:hypothetical protein
VTLGFFQDELESIYGVEAPRVDAFLVGREVVREASGEPRAPELLLAREVGGAVELALFLDEAVLSAAGRTDPHERRPRLVARATLNALACAAEGVTHFVYLATRAEAGRPVPRLELVVLAQVDNFALLLLHLWRRGLRRHSPALRRRLFEQVRFHAHLAPEEVERYRLANRLAAGYARWLEGRFVDDADVEGLLRELRRTYRRGGGEKIGYLGSRAA